MVWREHTDWLSVFVAEILYEAAIELDPPGLYDLDWWRDLDRMVNPWLIDRWDI